MQQQVGWRGFWHCRRSPRSVRRRLACPVVHLPLLCLGLTASGGLIAALAGLPLFQDGAHYFVQLYFSQAFFLPHSRYAAALFQGPAWLGANLGLGYAEVRFLFNLGYAAVPLCSLWGSWWVVRREGPELFVWPALFVLLINAVNFSWVSELLIATQLALPFFLGLLLCPGSKRFWCLFFVTVPVLFFLHDQVAGLFLALSLLSLAPVVRRQIDRHSARRLFLVFTGLWLGKLVWLVVRSERYDWEKSFISGGKLWNYLFRGSPESLYLLVVAGIAGWVLLMDSRRGLQRHFLWPVLLASAAIGGFLTTRNLRGHTPIAPALVAWGLLGASMLAGLATAWAARAGRQPSGQEIALFSLPTLAMLVLTLQYLGHGIILKIGATGLCLLGILMLAAMDRAGPPVVQLPQRQALVAWLAVLYLAGITVKATLWSELGMAIRAGAQAQGAFCVSRDTPPAWLATHPGKSVDNWALPSLVLAWQDTVPFHPLLISAPDCARLREREALVISQGLELPVSEINCRVGTPAADCREP